MQSEFLELQCLMISIFSCMEDSRIEDDDLSFASTDLMYSRNDSTDLFLSVDFVDNRVYFSITGEEWDGCEQDQEYYKTVTYYEVDYKDLSPKLMARMTYVYLSKFARHVQFPKEVWNRLREIALGR